MMGLEVFAAPPNNHVPMSMRVHAMKLKVPESETNLYKDTIGVVFGRILRLPHYSLLFTCNSGLWSTNHVQFSWSW